MTSEQVQLSSESQRRITSSSPVPIESHLSVRTGSDNGGRSDSNSIIISIVSGSGSGSQLQWRDRSSSVNLLVVSLNIERLFLFLLLILLLLLCTIFTVFREHVSSASDPLPLIVAGTELFQ